MQAIQRKWLRENKKIKGRAMSHPKRQQITEIQRDTISKTTTKPPASRRRHHRHHQQIAREWSISIVCVSAIPKQSGGCDKLHLCNLHYREHKRAQARSGEISPESSAQASANNTITYLLYNIYRDCNSTPTHGKRHSITLKYGSLTAHFGTAWSWNP